MKRNINHFLATLTLMIVSIASWAQGGLAPFAGSTHVYTVIPGDTKNTMLWSVSEGVLDTDYTFISGETTGQVEITWLTAGTYTLSFSETVSNTGCSTTKNVSVVVSANTFDVSTVDPAATCNAADGQPNYSGSNATTTITFTVNMTTGNSAFNPDWEIVFDLDPGTATLANVSASSGSLSGKGPYTLTGISSANGNGTVDMTMDASGDIFTIQNILLTLISATELTYSTPDMDTDDWLATQTINALPNTSAITTD